MLYLDCHNLETTLASIAGAIGVRADKLAQRLRDYEEPQFESRSEDPEKLMPREVPEQFGTTVDDARFGGAYYFHGTRVRDPGSFLRQGILPLDQIWSSRSGRCSTNSSAKNARRSSGLSSVRRSRRTLAGMMAISID